MFATPKRHILAQNREFWRSLPQNPFRGLGCSELQEPKKTNTFLVRKVTHARKRNPWRYRDELLHRCRGPRLNHLCQLLRFPLTGFERGGGSNFGILHWLASSPLQHSRTTVRVCDYIHGPIEYWKKLNDFCCFRCVIEQWALTAMKLLSVCFCVFLCLCFSVLFFIVLWVLSLLKWIDWLTHLYTS